MTQMKPPPENPGRFTVSFCPQDARKTKAVPAVIFANWMIFMLLSR